MDAMILFSQMACTGFLALWLTLGVRDNLLYPALNEAFTAEVMDMARLRADYPEAYALVAHRRVTNTALQRLAFRLVVLWEVLATLALWVGTASLALALLGSLPVQTARPLAMLAALMFTATWALFLIVGNHFCYWFGHEGAQNTHFQMTLWGTATLVFLVAG